MAIGFGTGGAGGGGPRLSHVKDEARRAIDTGRHRDAAKLLEGVLERAPEEWAAVLQLGDLYTRLRRPGPANALYRRLAEHYEEEGHQARSAAVWQKVLKNDPSFHGAHLKLGMLYGMLGRRVEARQHYETVLADYRKAGREGEASMIEGLLAELQDAAPMPRTAPADSSPDVYRRRAPEESRVPESPGPPAAPDPVEAPVPPADETPEPTTADEAEYVDERLLQARLLRRYNLLSQAREELERLLERVPDHVQAREELRDLLREQGEHAAAVEQQRQLEGEARPADGPCASAGAPGTTPPSPAPDDLEELKECVEGARPAPASDLEPLQVDIFADLGAVEEREEPGPDAEERQSPEDLARMVGDFRDRVDAQIEGDDFETRYNLGIAYRGMGLLDEAIAEFQRAAKDPERLFGCAPLLAACFVDKGLPQLAVSWLERGLRVAGRADEEYQELRYDLACALELVGDTARAAGIFVELYGENARLRDVAERVKALASPPAQEGTGTGGDASGARRGTVLPWRRG